MLEQPTLEAIEAAAARLRGHIVRTPTGFMVQHVSRDPADEETLLYWGDSFDQNFSFQGRTPMCTRRIIPVVNDPAVFVLESEAETLSKLY